MQSGTVCLNVGFRALPFADSVAVRPIQAQTRLFIDVTASVQNWIDGAPNFGWLMEPTDGSADGWFLLGLTSDVQFRPYVEVELQGEGWNPN